METKADPRTDGRSKRREGEPAKIASLTAVSWRPRRDLSMSEWLQQGRRLGTAGRHIGWWIGDWLRYGNTAYGERYARAASVTGYDAQTLMNMVYVASQVEISRRRENLSWSHHAEIASLSSDEQERWLALAETRRLSVRDLREELRCQRRQLRLEQPSPTVEDTAAEGAGSDRVGALTCPECGHVFATERPALATAGRAA